MIIYSHTNKITGLRYIGYTTKSIDERFKTHCKKSKRGSKLKFHNAIRKYGQDSWISEILEEIDNEEDLTEREKYWIKYYNSYENGYNLTEGGDGRGFVKGRKQTVEHTEKIRISHKNRWKNEQHPLKGRNVSEKTKKKIRNTLLGKKHTQERKLNQSIAAKNRKRAECSVCGKIMDICNIKRWHNEKCKITDKEI